ncbi:MAG: hypothetical protein B6U69_02240 [Thermofilum sp. ex4484_15]|nr:MAG: hypothetical protein B6U69_02240 [Thermofilum sp. ex4484_15]
MNDYIRECLHKLSKALKEAGLLERIRLVTSHEKLINHHVKGEALIIAILTGGVEKWVLEIFERNPRPVALLSANKANSLAATLEVLPLLRSSDRYLGCFLVRDWEVVPVAEIKELVRAYYIPSKIKGAKIGEIGSPASWLVSSVIGEDRLRELGLELDRVSIGYLRRILNRVKGNLDDKVRSILSASEGNEVSIIEVGKAVKLYYALRELARNRGWRAFTLNCFKLLSETGITPCLAFSLLNNEGLIAACEGDLAATFTMMLLNYLTEKPTWMANVVDLYGNHLILAHCTIPLNLTLKYWIKTHFETDSSVGIDGLLPVNLQVTLARVDEKLNNLMAFEGVIEESHMSLPYSCRTQVKVKLGEEAIKLLDISLGNHLVLTLGNHLRALKLACRRLGLKFITI